MRILQVLTHLNIGGITTYAYTLTKYLIRNKIEVAIASSGGSWEEDFHKLGAKVFTIDTKTKNEFSYKLPICLHQLSLIKKRFDFDIIHSHTRVTQVLSQIFSVLSGVPHVANFHGFYKQHKQRLGRKIFRAQGAKAIAITPAVKKDLIDFFGANPANVKIILSGIDLEILERANPTMKLKGSPIIGSSGRLSSIKGFEYLIKSMPALIRKYPNMHLYILGEGDEEANLSSLAKKLDVISHFTILKNVDLPDFLNCLDIFCLPSLEEPLGLSVVEAQFFGIPCVVSNVGGLKILVEGFETGMLAKPKDERSIFEAISILLDNDTLRRKISNNSTKQVLERFDIRQKVNDFIKVYQETLHENTRI